VPVDKPGDVEPQEMTLDIETAAAVQIGFELVDGRVGKPVTRSSTDPFPRTGRLRIGVAGQRYCSEGDR
jgi:hypothetical protein